MTLGLGAILGIINQLVVNKTVDDLALGAKIGMTTVKKHSIEAHRVRARILGAKIERRFKETIEIIRGTKGRGRSNGIILGATIPRDRGVVRVVRTGKDGTKETMLGVTISDRIRNARIHSTVRAAEIVRITSRDSMIRKEKVSKTRRIFRHRNRK